MTYEMYRYIFFGGAILSVIMLVVSAILFFKLNIRTVIGDLNGSNARKAIENIRSGNVSAVDVKRGTYEREKVTAKISSSEEMKNNQFNSVDGDIGTEKLGPRHLNHSGGSNETTVLVDNAATSCETTVLSERVPSEGTTVLSAQIQNTEFVVEYEIVYIHTDEVIV